MKGLDEPVATAQIAWAPLPNAGGDVTPCVGREPELDELAGVWARVRAGAGSVVLVSGEPGIGKTRLLTEFAGQARAVEGMVWWGAAFEGEARAYAPFTQLLDEAIQGANVAVLQEWLGGAAGLVARVAPGVRGLLEVVDEPVPVQASVERERTEDAVVEFIASAAASAPLVVVVDDAHWADPSTVALLRTLARRAVRLPLLVVIAYRDVELDRQHPLASVLPGLRREPHGHRLVLSGLDAGGVAALVSDLADQTPPVELVDALVAETLGNPFFVREVALHLVEEGRVRPGDGAWVADRLEALEIPEGVREVIGRRLSRSRPTPTACLGSRRPSRPAST